MKNLIVLCGENCGYCKKAKMLIHRALEKETKYIALDIRYISDTSDAARPLAHKLVPAFFTGGKLVFEGNPDINIIMSILENCYNAGKNA